MTKRRIHAIAILLLWIPVASLHAQQPIDRNTTIPAQAEAKDGGVFGKPVLLVGSDFGSFLRPAIRVESWLPSGRSPVEIVAGAAIGRGGRQLSAGLGTSWYDGHVDVRGTVTRQTDR